MNINNKSQVMSTTMVSYKEFIELGEHVILEMFCSDVFEGDVVNVGTNLFELVNIKQHNNPNKLQGNYIFYRTEVYRVFKLKVDISNHIVNVNSELCRICNIDREEYDMLIRMTEKYIYIDNTDSTYYKAVEDLKSSETIGVVPLGMDKCISTDIKLLGLCTNLQVYLFDIYGMKNRSFYPELKRIFESKYICKVLHGGLSFVNIFFKSYNVYTTNIFDTLIADLLILNKKDGNLTRQPKTLADCLETYLVLPSSILKKAQERTRDQWSKRPLSAIDRLYASQLCTCLIKVQQILKNIMLNDVLRTVSAINNYVCNLSDSEFREYNTLK